LCGACVGVEGAFCRWNKKVASRAPPLLAAGGGEGKNRKENSTERMLSWPFRRRGRRRRRPSDVSSVKMYRERGEAEWGRGGGGEGSCAHWGKKTREGGDTEMGARVRAPRGDKNESATAAGGRAAAPALLRGGRRGHKMPPRRALWLRRQGRTTRSNAARNRARPRASSLLRCPPRRLARARRLLGLFLLGRRRRRRH